MVVLKAYKKLGSEHSFFSRRSPYRCHYGHTLTPLSTWRS